MNQRSSSDLINLAVQTKKIKLAVTYLIALDFVLAAILQIKGCLQ
jgi:hypothetical protein